MQNWVQIYYRVQIVILDNIWHEGTCKGFGFFKGGQLFVGAGGCWIFRQKDKQYTSNPISLFIC